ncbi:hypothetical protein NQ314_003366 [Rhamnusium bicolor]|uniref:Uncharacterized protein n=1 Tax=Rhamnusium bicolor TaxID=1586634 RepID=A0AAV8ZNZ8_9CUCU|nr:hypothetical protein NQ314_003366 [Rhamnusium bicolor]
MPQQFIKVKENTGVVPNTAFIGSVKNQDWDSSSNLSNSTGDICRICHCEADAENPLLSPCYCSGSLKYVHQACLRQWLAASDTRSCELCKFNFILHTKIKPFSEWRILEMSSVERRRLLCAILFHFVAAVCVVWSLFVLIDRAAEEVQKGLIGRIHTCAFFMAEFLKQFSHCRQHLPSQVVTIAEYNQPSSDTNSNSQNDLQLCYVFENECKVKKCCGSSASSIQKADVHVEDLCDTPRNEVDIRNSFDDLARNNIIALDIECPSNSKKKFSLQSSLKTDVVKNSSCVFKSLPNLNTSSENLLL